MEDHQKLALIDQALSEKKRFEHCYINSIVSLNPWCAVTEIKYNEEQEEKLICIFFDLDVLRPQDNTNSCNYT